ncbi:MAG TPA: sulfatase [Coleofasciculaceae cyanobacterium]
MSKLLKLKHLFSFCLSLIFLIFVNGIFIPTKANVALQTPPNILFILTDDLDAAAVDYMPQVKSLLADGGTSFSNYFVNISLCCPSRATILRGQYAHNTGVYTNRKLDGSFIYLYRHGLDKSTIATWLQRKGYRNAYIGKYFNGYPRQAPKTYVPPGWDEWYSPIYDSGYLGYNYNLNENGTLVSYGDRPEDYSADVYTHKAQQFITQAAKDRRPFFAYISYFAPHQPAIAAPRHSQLFPEAFAPRTPSFNEADVSDKPEYIRNLPLLSQPKQDKIDRLYQRRLRSLQAVDEGLVTLVNTLEANHQLENTYIIFTSDNGFHLGQHRLHPAKETAYEEDIHLPLYIRGPDVRAGKIINKIVSNVDLAPTFAELAGAKMPNFVDGRSLVGLFRRHASFPLAWRQALFLQHRRNPELNQESANFIPDYKGLRTSHCTYVKYGNGEQELYNLRQDPDQLQNLAKVIQPKIIKQYARQLVRLSKCQQNTCRQVELQPLPDCTTPT